MSITPNPPATSGPAPTDADVRTELQKILASPGFINTERLSRFLRFVTGEVLSGRGGNLKEYIIGVEVFDRPEGYDPRTDPIVRVEARRLRSKLQAYYEAEGSGSTVLLEFPKGSYAPVFRLRVQPKPPAESLAGPPRRSRALFLVCCFAALAAAAAGITWRQALSWRAALRSEHDVSAEAAAFWGSFLEPGSDAYVIFGSPLFFVSQRERAYIRVQGVNDGSNLVNSPEFARIQKRFDGLFGRLDGPRYDYTLTGDALALERLSWFFGRADRPLTSLPAYTATWDRIKDSNIIFLGAPRMNPLVHGLPVRHDFDWGEDDGVVYNRNPRPGEQRIYTTRDHRDAMSYAVIGRFPGLQPERAILLLTAHSEPGIVAAVEQVTRLDHLRDLVSRLKLVAGRPSYFEVLIRVMVDKGAPVKIEYVTHHILAGPKRD